MADADLIEQAHRHHLLPGAGHGFRHRAGHAPEWRAVAVAVFQISLLLHILQGNAARRAAALDLVQIDAQVVGQGAYGRSGAA